MIMLPYLKKHDARPVGNQAGTAPGLPGPPTATGSTNVKSSQPPAGNKPCKENLSSESAPLVFAQWNAEGLRNKKPELQNFLRNHKVDIICIQETHLTDAHRFFLRLYELFRHDRLHRHKGGLVTLVRNTIPAVQTFQSDNEGTEFLAVKVILPDKEVTVINIYCPPDKELQLHTIPMQEKGLLIAGDVNAHSPSWGYERLNTRGEQTEDWMMENNLILINKPDDKPTCLSRAWKTSSHPDVAMATEDIQQQCERSVEDQLGGSDHLPILLRLTSTVTPASVRKDPSWNYKRANWTKFSHLTDTFCMEGHISTEKDINTNVMAFTNAIKKAAIRSIPRGRRHNYKPFWSSMLQELHDGLTKTRKTMETDPSPENVAAHQAARDKFDQAKTKEIRTSWQDKTASLNMERDTGRLWKLTKALNEEKPATYSPTVLLDDEVHRTGKLAANTLAEGFQQDCSLDIPRRRAAEVREQMKQENKEATNNPTMTEEFTIVELNEAIKHLKAKKAPGKDMITNEMVKNLGSIAKKKLLDIFNQSWNTGVFPHSWKEAILIPILKKGKDRHNKSSYRPISLLSCLGKTMERMVNKRLQYHLEKNRLINPTQSGFRKNRNTEDQVAYITQEIENGFQQKMKTLAVFVDLSKAFDKVWKEGLLLKLTRKNVNNKMFSWIKSYLFQRTARVKLDGHTSNIVKLREGVPQGGVISPTLFIVFIDDITDKLTSHISRALHADDLAIWTMAEHTATAAYRMQEALNRISAWADEWLVTINRTKTEATHFSLSPTKEVYSLKIDDKEIPQQETLTYLGVKLDRRLTWTNHLNTMESKAIKKMAILKKLAGTQWGANSRILTQVFTGTVRPHLEYASPSWSTAAKTNTARLSKVQNAALRIITGGMRTTPITAMEKTAGLHSLEERRQEKLLRLSEKLRRMPSHPLHKKLQEQTKNRLKRQSINHLTKALKRQHLDTLPISPQNTELLTDYEDWTAGEITIIPDLPGIHNKDDHSPAALRALTLETFDRQYPTDSWAHVFTDGSAEGAVRNGGGGVYMKFPDGRRISRSLPTGAHSTNFRAEACALLEAASVLNTTEPLASNTVILTDCRSLLQSLQSSRDTSQILQDTRRELYSLGSRTNLVLQWIPSHCGVSGNEKADKLSKEGSKLPQSHHSVSYPEARTIIKSSFHTEWKRRLNITGEDDSIKHLDRKHQVIIFRLRTGHCRLLAHLHKLKISQTDECPCGSGPQTPQHILQACPTYNDLRRQTWPTAMGLEEKLWGPTESLRRTANFVQDTNLTI